MADKGGDHYIIAIVLCVRCAWEREQRNGPNVYIAHCTIAVRLNRGYVRLVFRYLFVFYSKYAHTLEGVDDTILPRTWSQRGESKKKKKSDHGFIYRRRQVREIEHAMKRTAARWYEMQIWADRKLFMKCFKKNV